MSGVDIYKVQKELQWLKISRDEALELLASQGMLSSIEGRSNRWNLKLKQNAK